MEIKEAYGDDYERIKDFIDHQTGWCKITQQTTPGMCGQTAGSYVINAKNYNKDNYMGWAEWMPKKLAEYKGREIDFQKEMDKMYEYYKDIKILELTEDGKKRVEDIKRCGYGSDFKIDFTQPHWKEIIR